MKRSIRDRLRELRTRIRGGELTQGGGLGNEVNYHIFDYDPADERTVTLEIEAVAASLPHVKVYNVYDIIIDALKQKKYLQKSFDMEQQKGSDFVHKAIMRTLKTDSNQGVIVQNIAQSVNKGDIIFLTGIGQAYQIIRAHTLLANLQSVINDTETPVVLFYPGGYDRQALSLFNVFPAENYYRAFKLVDR